MINLIKDIFGALWLLPRWVFFWVMILFSINMSVFVWIFFDTHPVVIAAVIANAIALFPNIVLIIRRRGVGKYMAVSHLFGWIPLTIYLGTWIFNETIDGSLINPVYWLAWTLLVINTFSLMFDFNEAYAFFKGDRAILRTPAGQVNFHKQR